MSLTSFVPTPKFEEYKERFKEHYKLERRADGVILVQAHTKGGPIQLSVENHRSVGQLFKTIGADPENEIMIFTGTGEDFMMEADPEGFKLEKEDLAYWAYEYAYKDGRINVSSLINDLEIPTIGVLNGPGFHTEICLMCDLTICSEDAILYDLHYDIGSVPGDGIHSCFQELLGVKRAAYALLTGQAIDAKTALEYGMVNEVLPADKLLQRAWKLADHIMTQPRTTRRLTTQIVRRPWRQRITNDLDGGFGIQMFAHLAKKRGGARQGPHRFQSRLCSEGQEKQLRLTRERSMTTGECQTGGKNVPSFGQYHPADINHRIAATAEVVPRGAGYDRSFLEAMVYSDYREQYEDAVSSFLRAQEVAGLDICTDGDAHYDAQVGGMSWQSYPLTHMAGLSHAMDPPCTMSAPLLIRAATSCMTLKRRACSRALSVPWGQAICNMRRCGKRRSG